MSLASRSTCKPFVIALAMTWFMCSTSVSVAQPMDAQLQEAFRRLTSFELGLSLDVLRPIDEAVTRSASNESTRADLESRLIQILQADATDIAKEYVCRQLAVVGSDASIPVLGELLPNGRLSYMARYAIEGIGGPAAARILRESLATIDGRQAVGVVISLGRLADENAVPQLSALLDQNDPELREAAIVALGRIGSVSSANVLSEFARRVPQELSSTLVNAELQAAECLCRRGEYEAAVKLCDMLSSIDNEAIQAAAYRVLISAQPSESIAMILDGLGGEEPWKRAVAADCVAVLEQPEAVQRISTSLSQLPMAGRIAALDSLRGSTHAAVRQAALSSLDQGSPELCVAALEALVASGNSDDVSLLIDLASTAKDSVVRDAACTTLQQMTADGVEAAIIDLMNGAEKPNAVAVRCALARRSCKFIPAFLKAAESSDAATRLEAFQALEIMATEDEAAPLAALLGKTPPGEEREAADRAVWMSCEKIPNPDLRAAPLLAALETADAAGRCAILPSLARLGGDASLDFVHQAMRDTDSQIRDAGYRALSNWPDASVADELLEIAESSDVASYRIWSLRAYARVVSLPSERPPQETFEMLNRALELATRTEDKQLIVSRMEAVRVPEALDRLLVLLDDNELCEAAVPAIFTLAKGLSQSHPDQARAALERIQPLTQDAALLQQIPKVLRDMEARN